MLRNNNNNNNNTSKGEKMLEYNLTLLYIFIIPRNFQNGNR